MIAAGDVTRGAGPGRPSVDTGEQIERYVRLVEERAPLEEIERAEREVADALGTRPYVVKQQLAFFQRVAHEMRGTQAMQQFALTGGRVVVDRRDKEAEASRQDAAGDISRKETREDVREMHKLREGRLVKDKGVDSIDKGILHGGLEREAATSRLDKLLTAFEKMIIARFEDGKQLEHLIKDGKTVLAEKSEVQWAAFFKSFLSRTVARTVGFEDIKNFLLRGLIPKGEKGIFIGDMHLTDGRIEKFIRFSILADIIARLAGKKPGEVVGKGELGILDEDLQYLALAASRGREFEAAQKETEGKFMGGRAEARAAEELGFAIERQLEEKAKRLRAKKGKGLGILFEKDGEPEDIPYQFVPWWHWGNLSRPGKYRRFTILFYTSLLALALIGIIAVTVKLLSGGV